MTSTYTSNQGLEKPATGDRSGTWGTMTNTNMDILDRAISGVGALSLTGTTTTLTTSDGSASDGNYKVLVLGGSPSGTNTITLSPNDADKLYFVVNASGQSAIFSQGTGANVTVANGAADIIYADGAGSGAAVSSYLANDFVFKTGDGAILNLQTSDTTVTASSVLGRLNFTAPDEASGTDAILLAASIAAISEGTFAADNNATKLSFMTAASAAAAETMSLSSAGNLTVSGTYQGGGTMTTGGNIVIPNAGTIGSVGDASAMTIASGGGITFSDAPVFPDGSINLADLDIDGGTDIGEAIVDADLMIIDNGAGGTNRKTTAARLKTYMKDAGSVLQVVQNGTVGGLGSTSISYVDITNATAAITCSSTSSKVLVMWSAQASYTLVASTNVSGTYNVLRGTTSLGTRRVQVADGGGGSQGIWPVSFSYLDSPSSTDAQTYKVQQLVSSNSSTLTTSGGWLILVEIAG